MDGMDSKDLRGLFVGTVFNRDDPKKQHRVRAWIPGVAQPSGWLRPLGFPGLGSKNRGFVMVPKIGADLGVLFEQGDIEKGWYLPANVAAPDGVSDLPEESKDGYPDVQCIRWDSAILEIDERPATAGMRLRTTAGSELLSFDAVKGEVILSGVTRLVLSSQGAVEIEGTVVLINGRPVAVVGGEI